MDIKGEHCCWWRGGALQTAWNTCTVSINGGNANNLWLFCPSPYPISMTMWECVTWNPWAGERKNRWRNLSWPWWSPSVPSPGQTSSRPCFSARTYRMIYTVTLHICVCNWWNFFLKSAVTLFQCYTVDTFNKIWVNMWMVLLVWNCLSINSLNVPVMFMGHVRPCYS